MVTFYTADQRVLQERFETRRLADTQERAIVHDTLTGADKVFIAERDMLFLSTVDATGSADAVLQGRKPGFVAIDGNDLLLPGYGGQWHV